MLDINDPLIALADAIDWKIFEDYTTPEQPNNFTENLIPKRVKLDDKYRGAKR